MNTAQSPIMVDKLVKAGFSVTRIPMDELIKDALMEWLEDLFTMHEL